MVNSLKNLKWRGKTFDQWPDRMAVASNQYVADYLDKVGRMTWGLVTFNPTDKSGKPVSGPIRSGPPEFEILTEGLRQIKILP
jgi:hypothetical protein